MNTTPRNALLLGMSFFSIFWMGTARLSAQETSESLQLPEVVITGTDQSKIQREIPGISASQATLFFLDSASRDTSDRLISEGKLLAFVRPERAEEAFLQALSVDSKNSEAYLRLADVLRAQGKEKIAVLAYEEALKCSENTPEAHYQLGILYESRLQDATQAIEHYRAYLKAGGDDGRVNIWLRNLERREQTQEQTMTAP